MRVTTIKKFALFILTISMSTHWLAANAAEVQSNLSFTDSASYTEEISAHDDLKSKSQIESSFFTTDPADSDTADNSRELQGNDSEMLILGDETSGNTEEDISEISDEVFEEDPQAENTNGAIIDSSANEIYNYFVSGVLDGEVTDCVVKNGYRVIFDGNRASGKCIYLSLPVISSKEFTVALEVIGGSVDTPWGNNLTRIVEVPRLLIDGELYNDCMKISNEKWVFTVPAGTKSLQLGFYVNKDYTFSEHTFAVTLTDHSLIDGYYDADMPERYNRFVCDVKDGQLTEYAEKDGYKIVFDGKASSSGSFYIPLSPTSRSTLTISIEVSSGTALSSYNAYLTKIVENPRLKIDGVIVKDWDKQSDEKWVYTVPAGVASLELGFYVDSAYTFYAHTLTVTVTASNLISGYYDEFFPSKYNYFVSGVEDGEITECMSKDGYRIIFDGKRSAGKCIYLDLPIISADKDFTIAIEVIDGSVDTPWGSGLTRIVEVPRLLIDGKETAECIKVSNKKYIFTIPAGTGSLYLGFYINKDYTFFEHTLAITETNKALNSSYYEEYLVEAEIEESEDIRAERVLAAEEGRAVYFVSTSEGSDTLDGKSAEMPKYSLSQFSNKDNITLLLKSGDTFVLNKAFKPGNNVRITSYGGDEKPILCGLQEISSVLDYDAQSGLYSVCVSDDDIAHIVIDEETCWKRVMKLDDLTSDEEWICSDGMLIIKSLKALDNCQISYAKGMDGISITTNNVSIENLEISNVGHIGINILNGASNVSISKCYVHHIGGSPSDGDETRLGNGIQVWMSNCNNIFVTQNTVKFCFDAGITAQVSGAISRDESYTSKGILFEKNFVSDCMYLIETFQSNTGGMHCEVVYSKNYLVNCQDFVGAKYRKSTRFMAQICTWRILDAEDVVVYRENICIGSEQYAISFTADQSPGTFVWENNVFISDQETKFNVPAYYTGEDTFITVHSELTDEDQAIIQQYEALAQENIAD